MWEKIKVYVTVFVGGAIAGILIFLKFKEGDDSQDALEEAKLQGQESIVDQDIESLENELEGIEVGDLTDGEVVDFWEDV